MTTPSRPKFIELARGDMQAADILRSIVDLVNKGTKPQRAFSFTLASFKDYHGPRTSAFFLRKRIIDALSTIGISPISNPPDFKP